MTTTTAGPWGPDYVPVALRTRPVAAPTVSVDVDAQRREQERVQRPARQVVVKQPVPAVVLAERERRRQRRVGAWRAWGSAGLLLLAFAAALIAYDRALVPILRDAESSAGQLLKPLECAARTAIDAPVDGYTARQNRSFELSGVIESEEDYVPVWSPARDAACAGLND